MNEDLDYQNDVLKFKQIWNDNQNLNKTGLPQKNLQNIQSNKKNSKRKSTAKKQSSQKQANPKSTNQSNSKTITRNPKPNAEQVIQIQTRPQKFYQTSLNNEKNNIAQSLIYFDNRPKTNQNDNSATFYDMKRQIEEKDHELSLLRVTHARAEDRVRYLESQIEKKNEIIAQLRDRQRKVIENNCDLQSKQFNFDYGKAEYENFKNDSRRLLKMLQSTHEFKDFAKLALDDNGVRFLHQVNKNMKSKIDNPSKNTQTLHFCTCNKAFIPESGFWVPQKVYAFGRQFVKQRKGELTEAELELLLYELNRIWREREKRIINTYQAMKAHEVEKYKRKIQNMLVSKDQRSGKRSGQQRNEQ